MGDIKEAALRFIREYYAKHGKPSSVELMCREVEGLSRRKFYKIFRGGMAEACKQAGIPVPEERIKATAKARKVKAQMEFEKLEEEVEPEYEGHLKLIKRGTP